MLPFWLTSTADRPPLRIGLLLDGMTVPRWTARVIELVADAPFLRLELVVAIDPEAPAGASALYTMYERWDRGHVSADRDPLAETDIAARLQGVPRVEAHRAITTGGTSLPPDAVQRLRSASLDVLLDLSGGHRVAGLASTARYGVWRYEWTEAESAGEPPYFWETRDRAPVSAASLVVDTDAAPGRRLCTGVFGVQSELSAAANGLQGDPGLSTFVVERLRRLHEAGWEDVERRLHPVPAPSPHRTPPSSITMAAWLGPAFVRKIAGRIGQRAEVPLWRLAVRHSARTLLDEGAAATLQGFHWIDAPPGRFYADPFLIEEGGATWLFVEDADLTSWRGRITALQVDAAGALGAPVPVLDRPYHLSYPHLIRDGGNLYMIPETRKHGTIELYRCERFPDQWQLERELYRGPAVDTTVWIENGRYWFFVTFVDARAGAGQLWVFSATSLTGAWTSHPDNPVSLDVRWNRGAGALFRDARGRLIRPSQDGSVNYGRSFALNEIVTLDPARYVERPLVVIEPPEGFLGVHSYARAAGLEIVDGLKRFPQTAIGGRPPDEQD